MTTNPGVNIEQPGIRAFAPEAVTQGVAYNGGKQQTYALTASVTQTQAGAASCQLQYGLNNIETCANANDAVALPQALPGVEVVYKNSGAQTCKLFGKVGTTDTIDGTAGATGVTGPAAGKTGRAFCVEAGKWLTSVSA